MVKDPWWLYAYWEIGPSQERQARKQLAPEELGGLRSVLRVYDVTDRDFPNQAANRWFDIPLSGLATNWYVQVNAPNRSFVVDIGLLTKTGRFLCLARSNRVTTPRFGPSEVLDEEWMISDEEYWKLFGMTSGVGGGSSPGGLREQFGRILPSSALFSPGALSLPTKPKPKGFELSVETDVVVYGATDPKATVTIEGQAVKPHADGTFSVRMALPVGSHAIPVEATSPDRSTTKTVSQVVARETAGQSGQTARGTAASRRAARQSPAH